MIEIYFRNNEYIQLSLYKMENKEIKKQEDSEEKVGVVPASQIEGSDADTDSSGEASIENKKEQISKSDADADQQTAENDE